MFPSPVPPPFSRLNSLEKFWGEAIIVPMTQSPSPCHKVRRLGIVLLLLLWPVAGANASNPPRRHAPRELDFNRDVSPILAENCFACHGPDKNQRKARAVVMTDVPAGGTEVGNPARLMPKLKGG